MLVDPSMLKADYLSGNWSDLNNLVGGGGISQAGMSNIISNFGYDPTNIMANMTANGVNFVPSGSAQENTGWNYNVPDSYGSGGSGGVTNDQINGWLSAHPGATDPQIAQAMNQYGVSPQQMASAIGADPNYIQSRYNAATGAGGLGSTAGSAPVGWNSDVLGPWGGSKGSQIGGGGSFGSSGGSGAFGAGAAGGGYGMFGTQNNPYIDQMAQNMQRQTQLGLNDAFAQIRGNSVVNGNMGGSREGVAQGVATSRAMDALQGNLANLYGGAFDSQMNRGLQQYGIDTNAYLTNQGQQQNYQLGLGNLALGNQNSMLNFYTNQRAQDQSGALLGAQLYNLGQQGQWSPLINASGIYGGFSGLGGSATGTQQQGGGALGAFGGALGTYAFGANPKVGWW